MQSVANGCCFFAIKKQIVLKDVPHLIPYHRIFALFFLYITPKTSSTYLLTTFKKLNGVNFLHLTSKKSASDGFFSYQSVRFQHLIQVWLHRKEFLGTQWISKLWRKYWKCIQQTLFIIHSHVCISVCLWSNGIWLKGLKRCPHPSIAFVMDSWLLESQPRRWDGLIGPKTQKSIMRETLNSALGIKLRWNWYFWAFYLYRLLLFSLWNLCLTCCSFGIL